MTYIAKDLEDIARTFETQAAHARKMATIEKGQSKHRWTGQAYAWEQAARMLRETVLKPQ